jgi:hypothetical protein
MGHYSQQSVQTTVNDSPSIVQSFAFSQRGVFIRTSSLHNSNFFPKIANDFQKSGKTISEFQKIGIENLQFSRSEHQKFQK